MKISVITCLALAAITNHGWSAEKPNIVYILCDDLGYGDVHCFNPQRGKIPTPNIDKLASQGMVFTDAHSGSSVCSPTRYGVLTGRYSWRSRLQSGIVNVYGHPLIAPDRLTVPAMLKQAGYHTACIGKWHLGRDWPKNGKEYDFHQALTNGPTTRGFDYYFGTDVPNWPPYCFIENDRTAGIPNVLLPKSLVGNNQASVAGLSLPGWSLEAILPTITEKSCQYIADRSKSGKPFFLYFAMTSPHTPLAVTPEWKGKSGLNLYADYVMETDAMIGRVLNAIDKSGRADNTLVFLTSDNGCAPYIGVHELESKGHFPSANLRGYKSDVWDGGHRVPFIARWPGHVKPGSQSDQIICHTNLMATCAEIVGYKLPDNAGEDSFSILPAMLETAKGPIYEAIVNHSAQGMFAIRQGNWKLELGGGSGGWSKPSNAEALKRGMPEIQLYDMRQDIGERKNLQAEYPEVVKKLTKLLETYVANGRSTPGIVQKNDAKIDLWKKSKPVAAEPGA